MPDAPSLGLRRRSIWPALVLGLLGIAILCALGTWQVERLSWKQGIIDRIDARIHAAPAPAEEVARRAAAGEDIDYTPVTARGRFLHGGERHFLFTFEGQAGWNIYTPLLLGNGEALFVNRGFVPYDMKDPGKRRAGEVEGEVEITGLARPFLPEKPAGFAPSNDVAKNTFFWRSLPEMSAGLDLPAGTRLLPFVLDAGPGRAPGGFPVGGTTILDIPNNHLQYAITWYGLALVLAAMLGHFVWRRFRPASPKG